MLFMLDTADVKSIKRCNEFYPLAGVTTNPSIISKENKAFWDSVLEIRSIIGEDKMLHVQTVQTKASKIVEEAKLLKEKIGGNFYVKIPISEEGLKATKILKEMGIGVTVTAIFTSVQALIAAEAGADFVAPYVNRLDNILGDGTEVVAQIVKEFANYNINCKV
jgi:fructose-6-phosphate aldolase 2